MKGLVLGTILIICGCSPAPRSVTLPDGRQGYELNCSGTARTYSDCMNLAAQACGGPYQVFDQEEHSTGAMAMPVGNSVSVITGQHRTMLVTCGSDK